MTNDLYQNSIVVRKRKSELKREYTESSQLPTDAQKAMWGSEESMLNRFRLGLDVINWPDVNRWLDIGCGTGRFFEIAETKNLQFQQLIGVDITESIVAQARDRALSSPAIFEVGDLEFLPMDIQNVDLITLVGVLQLCGCPLASAVRHSVDRLNNNGQLFLTTKHLGWSAFSENGFDPDPAHSWFLMDDVRQAVTDSGVKILNEGGFLPKEGKIVPIEDTHTLFIHGQKIR